MVAVQFECLLFFSTLGFFAALRGIPGISEKISREAAENAKEDEVNRRFWQPSTKPRQEINITWKSRAKGADS